MQLLRKRDGFNSFLSDRLSKFKICCSLCVLAGIEDAGKINKEILSVGGVRGMSTYLGSYILTAVVQAGEFNKALECIREYWDGMLSLGATTFWEDFDINWIKNAVPIDRMRKEGEIDVHGSYGRYCYVGYRHSLCHGWASGPIGWLTEHVLGIKIIKAGYKILEQNQIWGICNGQRVYIQHLLER